MRSRKFKRLRLILGDQLNPNHSWYRDNDNNTLYLIAEMHQEATYVRHHWQKLYAFLAAMQEFAEWLEQKGFNVLYLKLDQTDSYADFPGLINELCEQYQVTEFEYQHADEWRLDQQLQTMSLGDSVTISVHDSEHFLLHRDELADYFNPARHQIMEPFYRKMRKRFQILMQDGEPTGGQWNYDAENRQPLNDSIEVPPPLVFENDVSSMIERIDDQRIEGFGHRAQALIWPINRQQALQLLDYFCQCLLPFFGRYQDAMSCSHEHSWSLFHSRLSFALNCKMLSPTEVIKAVLHAYESNSQLISLPQVEGYIRQILGWREYVRGMYWVNMPRYRQQNYFVAHRDLPPYFWNAETEMACMKHSIEQSLHYGYAHHIQRLMVTGNFCLLAGIHPDQVDQWYLGIYVDAIEWVELPNTRGMSQFADGGWLASKPYCSSGNYINKMSDYCTQCHYNVRKKTGEQSCPFNSMYWHFMHRHRDKLKSNPRVGMIYRNWDRQKNTQKQEVLDRADWCLKHLDQL